MRCLILWIAAGIVCAQNFQAIPRTIPQGQTLRIQGSVNADSARMNGRTVRLFPQHEGGWLGLMPVPALEKPGEYKLELLDKNGAVVESTSITVVDAHYPSQNIVISKALSELKGHSGRGRNHGGFRKKCTDTRYWAEPLAAPVPGCMTSLYRRATSAQRQDHWRLSWWSRSARGSGPADPGNGGGSRPDRAAVQPSRRNCRDRPWAGFGIDVSAHVEDRGHRGRDSAEGRSDRICRVHRPVHRTTSPLDSTSTDCQ